MRTQRKKERKVKPLFQFLVAEAKSAVSHCVSRWKLRGILFFPQFNQFPMNLIILKKSLTYIQFSNLIVFITYNYIDLHVNAIFLPKIKLCQCHTFSNF